MIPFNKPLTTGQEAGHLQNVMSSSHLSGNGPYTKKCQILLQERYKFKKVFLTTSCTDALEMSAILIDVKQGDEIIVPSYTFVSTALAFVRQGAKIVFADSQKSNPNIDADKIEGLISSKTKAIVVVHYAGVACEMDKIMDIARKYNLYVVEDSAQSIDSYYKDIPLGSIGNLGVISFHETKNIQCGEGGCLIINDEKFLKRAEIIWEKGTNRADFYRGEINKYGWVDIGSSFLPSELNAAFLFGQLEMIDEIQNKRISLWNYYYNGLKELGEEGYIYIQGLPKFTTNNGHMFYIICRSENERQHLINHLKKYEIQSVFHYQSLHKSLYYQNQHDGRELLMSDFYTNRLLRLPMYFSLEKTDIDKIVSTIKNFYKYEL